MEGIFTAKISEKNILPGFGGNTYSKDRKYKNNFFLSFLCIKELDIKMANITMKSYLKCEIEVIDKGKYFWINRKDLEIESDVANWAMIFDKCDPEKQKYRQELTPNAEGQGFRVFARHDLVERKIKSCRKSSKLFLEFKKKLGLDINLVTCDE